MKLTMNQVVKLKRDGNIRDYKVTSEATKLNGNRIERRSKEKDWISGNLMYWANENSLSVVEEYRFDEKRKWRFDWCVPALKIAIEFEGVISEKSRHTTILGYTGDTDKYREAAKSGWIVLRYTALNYKTLLKDLKDVEENKRL